MKIQHGVIVENIVISLYTKVNCDRLGSGKVLVNQKSDNNNPKNKNNNKNNVGDPKIDCSRV